MRVSSRSLALLTMSAALSSAFGSMRMSSGASCRYVKPRSGRSSCMLETPRSSRIASALRSLSASWPSTTDASPRRKRAWTPAWRLKRSKYGRTVGSRSTAMKRPRPRSSAASTAPWPPAPKVASTTVSPGWTSRRSRTSSARTGTWSAPLSCKTFGNMLRAPFELVALLSPGLAIPDLEPVPDAGDDDIARELRVRDQRRRDHHPPLLVDICLDRCRVEVALHLARFPAERVELAELAIDHELPLNGRVDLETGVQP